MAGEDSNPPVTPSGDFAKPPTNDNRRQATKMAGAMAVGFLCGAVLVGPQLDSWGIEPGAADVATLAFVTVHVAVAPANTTYPIPPLRAISLPHCSGTTYSGGEIHVKGFYDPSVSTIVVVRYPYGDSYGGGGDGVTAYFLHDGEYATIPLALMSDQPAMEVKAGPPPFVNWLEAAPSGGSGFTAHYLVVGATGQAGLPDEGPGNYSVTESYLVEFVPKVPVFLDAPGMCM